MEKKREHHKSLLMLSSSSSILQPTYGTTTKVTKHEKEKHVYSSSFLSSCELASLAKTHDVACCLFFATALPVAKHHTYAKIENLRRKDYVGGKPLQVWTPLNTLNMKIRLIKVCTRNRHHRQAIS